MSIKAEIIADSINVCGNRLTTFILEYPRFVHAELMTHRMFSKNSASSRAIPIEKMIQQVIDNPAMPIWWGKNQSGMQAKEELENSLDFYRDIDGEILDQDEIKESIKLYYKVPTLETAREIWLEARDEAIKHVKRLNKIGLHKQIANRILEPWFNIRIILSATEFENFFALRVHPDAQPEIQKLASLMLKEYNKLTPKLLQPGEWHIPFGDKIDKNRLVEYLEKQHGFADSSDIAKIYRKIAVARCARVSYFNFEGKDDYEADIALCDRLFANNPKHLSPAEHVACALDKSEQIGNYIGWKQYRKFFKDENLKDSRVLKK